MGKDEYIVDIDALENITRQQGYKNVIEIAKKMKMNRNTVGDVMAGREKPSSTFMYRFVAAFNVSGEVAGQIFFGGNLRSA